MLKKIKFLNILIDAISMEETLQRVENAIADKNQIHHTVDGTLEKSMSQRIKVTNFSAFTKDNE